VSADTRRLVQRLDILFFIGLLITSGLAALLFWTQFYGDDELQVVSALVHTTTPTIEAVAQADGTEDAGFESPTPEALPGDNDAPTVTFTPFEVPTQAEAVETEEAAPEDEAGAPTVTFTPFEVPTQAEAVETEEAAPEDEAGAPTVTFTPFEVPTQAEAVEDEVDAPTVTFTPFAVPTEVEPVATEEVAPEDEAEATEAVTVEAPTATFTPFLAPTEDELAAITAEAGDGMTSSPAAPVPTETVAPTVTRAPREQTAIPTATITPFTGAAMQPTGTYTPPPTAEPDVTVTPPPSFTPAPTLAAAQAVDATASPAPTIAGAVDPALQSALPLAIAPPVNGAILPPGQITVRGTGPALATVRVDAAGAASASQSALVATDGTWSLTLALSGEGSVTLTAHARGPNNTEQVSAPITIRLARQVQPETGGTSGPDPDEQGQMFLALVALLLAAGGFSTYFAGRLVYQVAHDRIKPR